MTKNLSIKLTETNYQAKWFFIFYFLFIFGRNQAKWFIADFGKSLNAHYPSLLQPTEFLATPI